MKNPTRFSQNFLRDPRFVTTLLSKTNITSTDTVYDIGGGEGIIAKALAAKCRTVVSIEIDARLAMSLRQNVRGYSNVLVYEADFLSLPLPQTPYKVFSNTPFNLSADIVRKLTDTPYPPAASYLIVQKEFADKLIARPGGYNSQLSIMLGVRFEAYQAQQLHPSDFYPRPRVSTVLLELLPRTPALVTANDLPLFNDFVAYAYNAWQPSMATALSRLFTKSEFARIASTMGVPADVKPTQLDLQQWLQLFEFAVKRRPLLESLVSGYQKILGQRHAKHSKLHRTRR